MPTSAQLLQQAKTRGKPTIICVKLFNQYIQQQSSKGREVDTSSSTKKLAHHAYEIRKAILETTTVAGSGHLGGSLSSVDILTTLFFVLNYSENPLQTIDNDRFILSCGHICPALYATLAETGYLKKEELLTLRQLNSRLQGHPSHTDLPIVETSSGSLGQGLSVALGKALALRLKREKGRVYCFMSDGNKKKVRYGRQQWRHRTIVQIL